MSEYNASTIENQVQDIAKFIESETEATRKGVRNQLVLAGLITVILIGYFFVWINPALDRNTQPPKLAAEISAVVNQNVPDVASMIEVVLQDATPELADFIADTVVKEGVPFVVQKSREFLVSYIEDLAELSEERLGKAFDVLLSDNRSTFEAAVKEPNHEKATKLFQPVSDKMHAMLNNTRNEGEAKAKIESAQTALHNMNVRLKSLSTKDPKKQTRREQMASRMLSTWWSWLKKPSVSDADSKPIPAGQGNTSTGTPIEAPPAPPTAE